MKVDENGCSRGIKVEDPTFLCRLHSCLEADYCVPDLKSTRTFPTVVFRLELVPTWAEVIADRPEGGQEALGMPR